VRGTADTGVVQAIQQTGTQTFAQVSPHVGVTVSDRE
jgi:hypothetical protein